MVVNVTKNSQKMKNKSLLIIEKFIIEWQKMLYFNYKKVFWFRKFCFSINQSIRNFFLLCLCLKSSLLTNKKFKSKYQKFLVFRLCNFLLEVLEVVQKIFLECIFWGNDLLKEQVWPNWLCLAKGSELKNWMLQQPVNHKACLNIQFYLREFYHEYKKLSQFQSRFNGLNTSTDFWFHF